MEIEGRLNELDERTISSKSSKRKFSLRDEFVQFLRQSNNLSLLSCAPNDVRKFLVWKDKFGKTIVHDICCRYLGCTCPRRLASATIESIVLQLRNIFFDSGLGRSWDVLSSSDREFMSFGLSVKEKFVLSRDQAWFNLQFFAGDRAGDLLFVVAREIKILNDETGFVFQHTFGKTLRGDKGKHNTFVIKKCDDIALCPITGLFDYVRFCKTHGVDLSTGYLFRIINESGRVLDQAVS